MMAAVLALVLATGGGPGPRSTAARTEFRQMNPCPATGSTKGPCKGYIIDHVVPLACGGPDKPSNMQWQTQADAKSKDRVERKDCKR